MSNSDIKVLNLSKKYDNLLAVDNISFTTKKGDIVAILGPNGAGKSTLINMISGYLSPSKGKIFIKNDDINKKPLKAKNNVGFLPEGSPLYPDLKVIDFLKYMAQLRCLNKTEIKKAIKIAKIESVLEQRVETLSKGFQRRVGFAQSILSDPPILLLDEPTDGLDPNQKKHIRDCILEMGKNKTILISTHLLEEAQTVCNRIILINHGKIVIDGKVDNILQKANSETLEEAFYKLTTNEE